MKKKVLLSSVLTIALCLCLIAGSTLALFTSESKVNVAVTSGTVKVVATATDLQLGSTLGTNLAQTSAQNSGNTVTLEKFVPGDYVTFNIDVENQSDVTVKYRTVIAMVEDDGLWTGLNVTIDNVAYAGNTRASAWATLAPNADPATVAVKVALPVDAGNEYQHKSCKFAYTVEAVQGNAETTDPDANTVYIYNVNDLLALCGTIDSSVQKIEFVNDLNMSGYNFTTLDFNNRNVAINGNGHTVTNLTAPLFNFYGGIVSVKNLTVDASDVIGNAGELGAAAIVEQAQWANLTMENCHVYNTSVTGGGTRAAALVGYVAGGAQITNCSVENCNVTAQGSVAGILGHEQRQSDYWNNLKLDNCSVKNSTLASTDNGGWRVGTMIGTIAGKNTTINENCVSTGNTLTQTGKTAPDHEWYGRIAGGSLTIGTTAYVSAAELTEALSPVVNGTSSFTLDKDYVVTDDWTPISFGFYGNHTNVTNLTIDGNGHTISGLTSALIEKVSANCTLTIKNLTVKGASISNSSYTNGMGNGIIVGYAENGNVTLDNCHVVDSSLTESDVAAAALIGYISGNNTIKIIDCSVKNTEINGDSAAAFIGYVQQANVTISGSKVSGGSFTGASANKQGAYLGTVNYAATVNISNTTADITNLVGRILSTGAVNYN